MVTADADVTGLYAMHLCQFTGEQDYRSTSPDRAADRCGRTRSSVIDHLGISVESQVETAEVRVPISSLVASDSPRLSGENVQHVHVLTESDEKFPPIIVHRPTMRIIDGMHRLRAAELRGEDTISVRYFDGDSQEAFVLAVKTNVTHGLPLTSADRSAAVKRIIASYPWWSDRAIATIASVSAKTVATIRRCATEESTQLHTRIGRDGKARPLDVAERRRRASQLLTDNPNASLREIARVAGISPSTARNVRARLRDGEDPIAPRQRNDQQRQIGIRPVEPASKQGSGCYAQRLAGKRASLLENLRRDPSLRFNEAGRIVLRLIDAHTMDAQEWQRLADHVPMHCVDAVSIMARECASDWQGFANLLARRRHSTA